MLLLTFDGGCVIFVICVICMHDLACLQAKGLLALSTNLLWEEGAEAGLGEGGACLSAPAQLLIALIHILAHMKSTPAIIRQLFLQQHNR